MLKLTNYCHELWIGNVEKFLSHNFRWTYFSDLPIPNSSIRKKTKFYLLRLYILEKGLSTSIQFRSILANIFLYRIFSIFETVHNIAEDAASLNSNKIPSACYRNELLLFYVIAVWEQKPFRYFRFPRISYFPYRYPPSCYISHLPHSYIRCCRLAHFAIK